MPKTNLVDTRAKLLPEICRSLRKNGTTQIKSITRELSSDASGISFKQTEIITYGERYQTVLVISPAPAEKRMRQLLTHGPEPIFRACAMAPDRLEIRVADYALPDRLRAEVERAVGVLF
jgi:hypothetical protein